MESLLNSPVALILSFYVCVLLFWALRRKGSRHDGRWLTPPTSQPHEGSPPFSASSDPFPHHSSFDYNQPAASDSFSTPDAGSVTFGCDTSAGSSDSGSSSGGGSDFGGAGNFSGGGSGGDWS
jgi:uncharacterized membrane protein YgcG